MGGNDSLSLGERADGSETAMRSLPPLLASLLATAAATAQSTSAPTPEPAPKPPNVVLIVCDDLNDWVGCMGGHPLARTPNIDELAKRGVLFANAHVPSPMSGPSRTAMLTGEPDWRTRFPLEDPLGVRHYTNAPIALRDIYPLATTLPQHFRANGYSALCAGKIFHPKYDPPSWSERFVDDAALPVTGTVHGSDAIPFDWRFTDMPTDQFPMHKEVSWACARLSTPRDEPFFMGVGISAPHLPWYLPRSFASDQARGEHDAVLPPRKTGDLDDVSTAARKLAFYRKAHEAIVAGDLWDDAARAYLAMVEFADLEVGRVMRALDTGPHRKNTIVVLTSDHGFHVGEKNHWTKGTLWEESTRVPLIVSVPGMATAGTRCDRPVSTEAIYPTLADLAGIPPNPRVETKSLKPLVENPQAPWDEAVVTSNGPEEHAVRTERWRYIVYGDGTEELYDHDADPNEWTNVASAPENAATVEHLRGFVPKTGRYPLAEKADVPGAEALRGRKNVLFIAVDDLNDWVGCLGGHPDAKTPNIDRLAQSGLLFTRAYCPGAICGPSRAAILSGAHPSASGVWEVGDLEMRSFFPKDSLVTLPERFLRHGYASIGTGKVFHYPNDEASWSKYYHVGGYPAPDPMPGSGVEIETPYREFDWGSIDKPDAEFVDVRHTDWAIQRLAEQGDKPFFLALGIIKPHLPWHVPKRFFDMYDLESIHMPETIPDDLADVPQIGKGYAHSSGEHDKIVAADKWREGVRAYLAAVSYADFLVGRMVDALDASPHADDTIVVLWSDHGQHLGEKEHWRKNTPWEETARVPLVVRIPGMATNGQRCDRVVSLQDIYPTLLDLCFDDALPAPSGESLVPLLVDPNAEWNHPAITSVAPKVHGIRDERWRYVTYGGGQEELYDHDADPNEWRNVVADPANAEVVEKFRRLVPPPFAREKPKPAATPTPAPTPAPSPALQAP